MSIQFPVVTFQFNNDNLLVNLFNTQKAHTMRNVIVIVEQPEPSITLFPDIYIYTLVQTHTHLFEWLINYK